MTNQEKNSICLQIISNHRFRQATIKSVLRLNNQTGAMTRTLCGYNPFGDEKEQAIIIKRASKILNAMNKGDSLDGEDGDIMDIVLPFSISQTEAAKPIVKYQRTLEKQMEKLAKSLPVWSWVEGIRGFGPLALAMLIGETGSLDKYSNPSKVWKRMGVAVINGERQRKIAGTTDEKKAEAIAHGYNPSRRSVLFNVGDTMIKGNRDGKYRTTYLARKELEESKKPDDSKMAWHRRSQRFMEKLLIKDLWLEWTGVEYKPYGS